MLTIRTNSIAVALLLAAALLGCPPARPSGQPLPVAGAATSCANISASDASVYDTTQVDERPVVRSTPALQYPAEAAHRRIGGKVMLSAIVNADGRIDSSSVAILHSVDSSLDAEAERFVRGSVLWPACRRGEPVRVRVAVPVVFQARRSVIGLREAFLIGLLGGMVGWLVGGR